jgi:precorrin-3B C17-methyltransferase
MDGNLMSGVLNLVSVGPGYEDLIVPRAIAALRDSDVIVAYELYLRWIAPHIEGKQIFSPPLTQERERAQLAIEHARAGAKVALISSGDIGIYAMAALAYEEMREDDTYTVNLVPGVTSANACASLLGSPLSHDFATLSLSDLLCPWDWIEHRARHIAQADLACVMYNVQSASRQEGVYRVLQLMLESKAPGTLCGVVRNAYRPGQQVDIYRLDELPGLKFDMLTTIVMGNRFTARKRGQIFTPRGYNDWAQPEGPKAAQEDDLPAGAVWVFSGTSDGNALAAGIAAANVGPVVVSAASDHGGDIARQDCPGVAIWSGRQGVEARRRVLTTRNARVLLDATHPYASSMSQQLMALSRELGIPYLRYERPSEYAVADGEVCATIEIAAARAVAQGQRIFLATGSKDLATFMQTPGAADKQWFVRQTADPELIERALALGIPRERICAMQGPFSPEFNTALWRDWGIDCVVTKDSGGAGGYRAKVQAAQALGIPLLVVARPQLAYPALVANVDDVLSQLSTLAPGRAPA